MSANVQSPLLPYPHADGPTGGDTQKRVPLAGALTDTATAFIRLRPEGRAGGQLLVNVQVTGTNFALAGGDADMGAPVVDNDVNGEDGKVEFYKLSGEQYGIRLVAASGGSGRYRVWVG